MNKPQRLYHVIAINEKTGHKTYLTTRPEEHAGALIILSKHSKHPLVRKQLEEVAAR